MMQGYHIGLAPRGPPKNHRVCGIVSGLYFFPCFKHKRKRVKAYTTVRLGPLKGALQKSPRMRICIGIVLSASFKQKRKSANAYTTVRLGLSKAPSRKSPRVRICIRIILFCVFQTKHKSVKAYTRVRLGLLKDVLVRGAGVGAVIESHTSRIFSRKSVRLKKISGHTLR